MAERNGRNTFGAVGVVIGFLGLIVGGVSAHYGARADIDANKTSIMDVASDVEQLRAENRSDVRDIKISIRAMELDIAKLVTRQEQATHLTGAMP